MTPSKVGFVSVLIGVALGSAVCAQGVKSTDVVGLGKKATALVEVTVLAGEGGGSGTAFCIDKSGLFITNAHVIDEAEGGKGEIRLVLDTGKNSKRLILRARIVRSDVRLDLALLKVDPVPDLVALELGSEAGLKETMPVTTFGFPFGSAIVFHRNGYPDITVLESKITSLKKDKDRLEMIQFDNQLNPGNSGGPVLGPDGAVVGVAAATVRGAAINFAIPVGQLQAFLKAPALVFEPPTLPYKDRAKPVTWTIKAQPPTANEALPKDLSVSVKISTDITPPRTFAAKSIGDGTFRVTFTPVPSDAETPVELRAVIAGNRLEAVVPDRVIHVGNATFLLSDLQQLNDKPPRVITRKGLMVVGPITGLGTVRVRNAKGKQVTLDLSSASVIQVAGSAATKPLRAIEAIVELKRGTAVVATRARRMELPGAPVLVVDRATGRLGIAQQAAPPVRQSADPATDNVKRVLGGFLQTDGVPKGAGLAVKPPAVSISDAFLADAPATAAKVPPREPLVRELDAKFTDLVVGGGGRYLILTLKDAKQIAIFDVNVADFVKRIDIPAEEVLVAAGAEKLILLYPKEALFQRWNLNSLSLEGKAEKQPIDGRIHNIVMGSDSDGPILAFWTVLQWSGVAELAPARCCFIDPLTLKVLKIEAPSSGGTMGNPSTSDGSFAINYQAARDRIHLRASPGGALFGSWCTSHGPSGVQTIVIEGRSIRLGYEHLDGGHVVPGADGQTIFTGSGSRRNSSGALPVGESRRPASNEILIPSIDPSYYLGVMGIDNAPGQPKAPVAATVRMTSNRSELTTVRDLNEMVGVPRFDSHVSDGLTIDQRFHFIPAANLLITVPASNDRLVLRRLNLAEAIARSAKSILVVTSTPALSARRGQQLTHQIQVHSSKGGTTFELSHGPDGLSVSGDGTVQWKVPLNAERKEYEVIVMIGDSSRKQVFHTVSIKVQ